MCTRRPFPQPRSTNVCLAAAPVRARSSAHSTCGPAEINHVPPEGAAAAAFPIKWPTPRGGRTHAFETHWWRRINEQRRAYQEVRRYGNVFVHELLGIGDLRPNLREATTASGGGSFKIKGGGGGGGVRTFAMALYLSFSRWYVTLYFSTGSSDSVLWNSPPLFSPAQRASFGSRSVENQAGFGYATPSENQPSGSSTCSSSALRRRTHAISSNNPTESLRVKKPASPLLAVLVDERDLIDIGRLEASLASGILLERKEGHLSFSKIWENTTKSHREPEAVWDRTPGLTFDDHLLLGLWSVAVDFGDDGSDAGRPGPLMPLLLCVMVDEGHDLVPAGLALGQQDPQSPCPHMCTFLLVRAAKALVYNVRLLYPHVHGRPKPFGESFGSTWKLYIAQFRHGVNKFDTSQRGGHVY